MIDISAVNVVKAFEQNKNILDGLSFEVYEGEHVGLLGMNGAGKTTLLRIITGELERLGRHRNRGRKTLRTDIADPRISVSPLRMCSEGLRRQSDYGRRCSCWKSA